MSGHKNCINGLEDLISDLDTASKNVSNNSDEIQLLIDYELIFKNILNVNNLLGTSFNESSTKDDINDFFSDAYADILINNLFSSNLDVIKVFNDRFNPYAKVD